jgi:hypothetical protein
MQRVLRSSIGLFVAPLVKSAPAFATCGDRGGPAFRLPNDKCAGWKDLDRACGVPPTTRCTFKGGGIGATSLEQGQKFLVGILPASPTTASSLNPTDALPSGRSFNKRKIRADGIACSDRIERVCDGADSHRLVAFVPTYNIDAAHLFRVKRFFDRIEAPGSSSNVGCEQASGPSHC